MSKTTKKSSDAEAPTSRRAFMKKAVQGQIPDEDMWNLVNYIKSLTGG